MLSFEKIHHCLRVKSAFGFFQQVLTSQVDLFELLIFELKKLDPPAFELIRLKVALGLQIRFFTLLFLFYQTTFFVWELDFDHHHIQRLSDIVKGVRSFSSKAA